MLEDGFSDALRELLAKKRDGLATGAELATLDNWLAQHAVEPAGPASLDAITFQDKEAEAAWFRMQKRAQQLPPDAPV